MNLGDSVFDLDVEDAVKDNVDQFMVGLGKERPVGLLLWGPHGTGKTAVAQRTLAMATRYANRDWLGKRFESDVTHPCWYEEYATLLRRYRESFGATGEQRERLAALFERLFCDPSEPWLQTRVLVLDDVGQEVTGERELSQKFLHDLLRSRWHKGSPTIITTNIAPEGWEGRYGSATWSFIHEAYVWVRMGGKDRRRAR